MAAQNREDDLCSLCLECFKDPRYVPCGNLHVFCHQPCLQRLVRHYRQQGRFPCPLCRTPVVIPRGGAAAFPRVSSDAGTRTPRAGPSAPPPDRSRATTPFVPRPASGGQHAVDLSDRVNLSTTPRGGPATPPGLPRPPSVQRVITDQLGASILPGMADDPEWAAELRHQESLWRENMRRMEENADRQTRQLIQETARPSFPSLQRQDSRREEQQTLASRGSGWQQESLPRILQNAEQRREQEQRRLERLARKQEKLWEQEERRQARLREKQDKLLEKERRRQERLEEKAQRRAEQQLRQQERQMERRFIRALRG